LSSMMRSRALAARALAIVGGRHLRGGPAVELRQVGLGASARPECARSSGRAWWLAGRLPRKRSSRAWHQLKSWTSQWRPGQEPSRN